MKPKNCVLNWQWAFHQICQSCMVGCQKQLYNYCGILITWTWDIIMNFSPPNLIALYFTYYFTMNSYTMNDPCLGLPELQFIFIFFLMFPQSQGFQMHIGWIWIMNRSISYLLMESHGKSSYPNFQRVWSSTEIFSRFLLLHVRWHSNVQWPEMEMK